LKRFKLKTFIYIVIVFVAVFIITRFINAGNNRWYTVTSTGDMGASVFYDTLRHMGYPARIGRQPLTADSNLQNVYILIHPHTPHVSREMAEEMVEWVRRGGRLVFLHTSHSSILNIVGTEGETIFYHRPQGRARGYQWTLHQVGHGEIIIGSSRPLLNAALVEHPYAGIVLESHIRRWQGEEIMFAEYYLGFTAQQTFIGELPFIVQLVLAQLVLAFIILVWHLGKRFGNPVPYYEEEEREENEHVRALARLYMKTKTNIKTEAERKK